MSFSPTVYPSLFLKADRRAVTQAVGSAVYRTSLSAQTHVDDVFIAPGAAAQLAVAAGPLLLLPVVAGALLGTGQEEEKPLVPGCIYAVSGAVAGSLTLNNPFEKETANVVVLQVPGLAGGGPAVQEFELPLTAKNVLVTPPQQTLPVQVGLFDSRVKGIIPAAGPKDISLCYVLNGSFEIDDRLVEYRDALLLWDTPAIEFESLSETAILFCLKLANF